MSAKYGLFSGFAPHVENYSKKLKVKEFKAFDLIGKKKLVAGQEDLIMEILSDYKKNEKKNK